MKKIGGVVLVVINMINIRERKYEIGVLRTVGMKKSLLSLQFISELLMVAIVSLLIGAAIGSACSVPVANNLLANEISNSSSKYDDIGKNFGFGDMPNNDMDNDSDRPNMKDFNFGVANVNQVDSIDAVVDYRVLLKLLGMPFHE